MQRLTNNDLDALEAARSAVSEKQWAAGKPAWNRQGTPYRTAIHEVGGRTIASAPTPRGPDRRAIPPAGPIPEYIALAHNALPALIAAARQTVPEPISEKHRDGNWWLVWAPGAEQWMKCRWLGEYWGISGTMRERLFDDPTHALPLPAPPEPLAARGEE
jgi:hypothetical protein